MYAVIENKTVLSCPICETNHLHHLPTELLYVNIKIQECVSSESLVLDGAKEKVYHTIEVLFICITKNVYTT